MSRWNTVCASGAISYRILSDRKQASLTRSTFPFRTLLSPLFRFNSRSFRFSSVWNTCGLLFPIPFYFFIIKLINSRFLWRARTFSSGFVYVEDAVNVLCCFIPEGCCTVFLSNTYLAITKTLNLCIEPIFPFVCFFLYLFSSYTRQENGNSVRLNLNLLK